MMKPMNLFEVAEFFYSKSSKLRLSSHWDHLDQFGPDMFRQADWLNDFLRRWVSVGFCDTTMNVPDRFTKKKEHPFDMIGELSQDCLHFDAIKAKDCHSVIESQFPRLNYLSLLGSRFGEPFATIQLKAGSGQTAQTSFHEMSLAYMALRISAMLRAAGLDKQGIRVLEIGAGYGGLFEKLFLLRKGLIDTFYLVDVPFNLTIQYWFIDALHKAGLHDLDLLPVSQIGDSHSGKIVFVPVDDIERIGEIDLAINARSFGEMYPADVQRYLDLIQNRLRPNGLFYNMNRYEKSNSSGDVLRLNAYPYDTYWNVLNHQLVYFFHGIGELVLQRSVAVNPNFFVAMQAIPPYEL